MACLELKYFLYAVSSPSLVNYHSHFHGPERIVMQIYAHLSVFLSVFYVVLFFIMQGQDTSSHRADASETVLSAVSPNSQHRSSPSQWYSATATYWCHVISCTRDDYTNKNSMLLGVMIFFYTFCYHILHGDKTWNLVNWSVTFRLLTIYYVPYKYFRAIW